MKDMAEALEKTELFDTLFAGSQCFARDAQILDGTGVCAPARTSDEHACR